MDGSEWERMGTMEQLCSSSIAPIIPIIRIIPRAPIAPSAPSASIIPRAAAAIAAAGIPSIEVSQPMLVAPFAAGLGHLFLDAAVLEEVLLELFDKVLQQVIGLVDEDEGDVRQGDVIAILAHALVVDGVRMFLAPLSSRNALLTVGIPNLVTVIAQIVLVVLLQFLEACFGNVDQLDASLHRGGSSFHALGNVLLPAARCLLHLIDRAVAYRRQVMLHEIDGDIVDAFRFLEGEEVLVVAFRGEEIAVHGFGGLEG